MTAYPSSPGDYYSTPKRPARPGAVTAAAVLAIILGTLALLCGGLRLIQTVAAMGSNLPIMEKLKGNTPLLAVGIALEVAHLIIGGLGLAGGIAALSLRPWARGVLIIFAVFSIIVFVAEVALQFAYIGPQTQSTLVQMISDQQEKQAGPRMSSEDIRRTVHRLQIGFAVVGGIFMLVLPALVLLLITRPSAAEALAPPFKG